MIGVLVVVLLAGPGHASPRPGIRWERSFEEALRKARAASKPVMVDFWAEWCTWCHRLDETTYVDPAVVARSQDFVAVKVNTEGGPRHEAVAFRYDVVSLPTILFLTPGGRLLQRVDGYQGPGHFPRILDGVRETASRVIPWEQAVDRAPASPEALSQLGAHLVEQDELQPARELLERARRADGELDLPLRKRNRMLLAAIQRSDHRFAEAEVLVKEALALPASAEHDAKLLYLLGKVYLSMGREKDAREPLQRVVREHPRNPIAQKARETLLAMDKR
jgi:thioredoxin-like negative regulator of GroEL